MMNKNAVYQRGIGAKHYKEYTPLFNYGARVIIGKYGTMAMEHMKETAPLAYSEYSKHSEFKYILADINEKTANRISRLKRDLKKEFPTPKTDDFFKLAEHSRWIQTMAEDIAVKELVFIDHISDEEVKSVRSAKHARHLN